MDYVTNTLPKFGYALYALFTVLQLLDFYTTWTIFRKGGDDIPDEEKNPHMRKLMERYGVRKVLTVKTLFTLSIGLLLLHPAIAPYGLYALVAVTLFYIWVIHHNWKSMP